MTLQSRIYLIVGAALTPMVLFALVAALMLAQQERESREREALARAHAAMSAVDAHLRGAVVSLGTLAASKNLESGDIEAFHRESQRVLRTQPSWENIGLASSAKTQLSNAVDPFPKPQPFTPEDDSFAAVLRGDKSGFSNVMPGVAVRSPTVRVRIPVTYGEEVRYIISAPLNLKHLAALLEAQQLPDDWVIALVDREKQVIVRIPDVKAGTPVTAAFRDEIGRAPEGWFSGPTLDGRPAYTAYVTSSFSGWVLGIGIPAETVEAGERRTYAIIGFGFVLAFALGLVLAWRGVAGLST
jgi:hypothetical protein